MELGSQNHSRDGLLGPNSIIVVYMDPLGIYSLGFSEFSAFGLESWAEGFGFRVSGTGFKDFGLRGLCLQGFYRV